MSAASVGGRKTRHGYRILMSSIDLQVTDPGKMQPPIVGSWASYYFKGGGVEHVAFDIASRQTLESGIGWYIGKVKIILAGLDME